MKAINKSRLAMGAFLAVCITPAVGMFVLPAQQPAANQVLADKPDILLNNGEFNLKFLNETSDYVADHLGMRQELITINNILNAKVFGVSTQNKVVLGKDDWLFYTETIDDYLNINHMTDGELFAAAKSLSLLSEYAQNKGAKLFFTVAPNKATLYPEYLPNMGEPLEGDHNLQSLIKWLDSLNVNYIDLLTPLSNEQDILYYKTDSHWTEQGAALAHDILIDAVGKTDQMPFFNGEVELGESKLGDLYTMIYPDGSDLEQNMVYKRQFDFSYVRPIRSVEDQIIETQSNKSGRLLMFRDSFGNSLHAYLADAYGYAVFSRAMPYSMSLLEQYQPDTVLIEICERNLNWLATKTPIFPAPQRIISSMPSVGNAQYTISTENDEKMLGFIKVEGTITGDIDETSPIYVKIGDNLYEATPVGDRTNGIPFTLYIPQADWNDNITVIYEFNQLLYTAKNF